MSQYSVWIEGTAKKNRSNIVLALDLTKLGPKKLLSNCLRILKETASSICAIKLNRQVVLPLGLRDGIQIIIKLAHKLDLPIIMDCKINDVGHTNEAIAEQYFSAGFDAVTVSPFVGWKDGVEPVFKLARQLGKGVILLVYMSHKGAEEGYGQTVLDPKTGEPRPQYMIFAEKALKWGADGAVVGATYPEKISVIYKTLGTKVPIYSPGVRVQGGDVEAAIQAGATYLIIGRAIFNSANPQKTSSNLKNQINEIVTKQRIQRS
jgi:orotidine-5'-phosphate decarboxylase